MTNNRHEHKKEIDKVSIEPVYKEMNKDYILANMDVSMFDHFQGFNFTRDIMSYLEFSNNAYIPFIFSNASEAQLDGFYQAKSRFFEAQHKLLDVEVKKSEERLANSSHEIHKNERKAASQSITASFVPFNQQIGSYGYIAVGFNGDYWCVNGEMIATKMPSISSSYTNRYVSKGDSIFCITDSSIVFSSSNTGGIFSNPYYAYNGALNTTKPYGDTPYGQSGYFNWVESLSNNKYRMFFGDFDGSGYQNTLGFVFNDGFYMYQLVNFHGWPCTSNICKPEWDFYRFYKGKNTWCNLSANGDLNLQGIRVGDFNGDGKDDLFCFNPNGTQKILFNSNAMYNQWISPPFSLNGVSWCEGSKNLGHNVYIGDFNGDAKDDLLCVNGTRLYFLFSNGDGTFYAPSGTGNGYLDLVSSGKLSYTAGSSFLVTIGDFDGDGYSDMFLRNGVTTEENFNTLSNYILFGSDREIFISGTEYTDGFIEVGGVSGWCSGLKTNVIAGDFNADGKDDLLCQASAIGLNSLMLSESLPVNIAPNYQVSVTLSNFYLVATTIDMSLANVVTQSVVCDNRVRPDETLTCKASTTFTSVDISSIETTNGWENLTALLKNRVDSLYINTNYGLILPQVTGSSSSNTSLSFYTSKNTVSDSNTFTSSAETIVKSGDCIKITTTTKHIYGIKVPYSAEGSVGAVDNDGLPLTGSSLLNIARKSVPYQLELNSDSPFEAVFNISGQVTMDLVVDTNTLAENC